MPKNAPTTAQLHSSHKLVIIKILSKPSLNSTCMNRELSDDQAGFRKGRETRDQIGNIC